MRGKISSAEHCNVLVRLSLHSRLHHTLPAHPQQRANSKVIFQEKQPELFSSLSINSYLGIFDKLNNYQSISTFLTTFPS